jgi:hypothetical protein
VKSSIRGDFVRSAVRIDILILRVSVGGIDVRSEYQDDDNGEENAVSTLVSVGAT